MEGWIRRGRLRRFSVVRISADTIRRRLATIAPAVWHDLRQRIGRQLARNRDGDRIDGLRVVASTVGPHRQTALEWDVVHSADGSDKNEGEPQIGDFPELSRGPLAHLRIIYGERTVTTRKRGRRHPRQRVTKTRAGP